MCCLANAIFNHIMSKYTAEDRNEAFLYEDNCSYPTKEDKWKLSLGGNISFRSRSRQGRPVQGRDNQIGSVHLVNGARSTDSANVPPSHPGCQLEQLEQLEPESWSLGAVLAAGTEVTRGYCSLTQEADWFGPDQTGLTRPGRTRLGRGSCPGRGS